MLENAKFGPLLKKNSEKLLSSDVNNHILRAMNVSDNFEILK